MNRSLKLLLTGFTLFLAKLSFASQQEAETSIKIKDLDHLGVNQNIVLNAFSDEIQLSPDEIIRFKKHAEKRIIDITTSDGRFRSITRENETPKNITNGRVKFLLTPERSSKF